MRATANGRFRNIASDGAVEHRPVAFVSQSGAERGVKCRPAISRTDNNLRVDSADPSA